MQPGSRRRDDVADWQTVVQQLGLTQRDAQTLDGAVGAIPIRVHRIIPGPRYNPQRHTSPKTEISASVTARPIDQFLMHERARFVLGQSSSSGDPEFDARFVIRSKNPMAIGHLWSPDVRSAIEAYATLAPSCEVTNRGVELLIEGAVPATDYIRQIIYAQVRIVAALESAAAGQPPHLR